MAAQTSQWEADVQQRKKAEDEDAIVFGFLNENRNHLATDFDHV